VGLELMLFLLQPPKCWDYRPVPPQQDLSKRFLTGFKDHLGVSRGNPTSYTSLQVLCISYKYVISLQKGPQLSSKS
jgi:hypothetical protein